MNPKREQWWTPSYTSAKGNLVQINGISSNECPVSLTDGWMFQMLMDFSESRRFEGALMYGPNLAEWPVEVFDAFSIFHYEDNRVENAKMEVDSRLIQR